MESMVPLLLFALIQNPPAPDPFAPLAIYNGAWTSISPNTSPANRP